MLHNSFCQGKLMMKLKEIPKRRFSSGTSIGYRIEAREKRTLPTSAKGRML